MLAIDYGYIYQPVVHIVLTIPPLTDSKAAVAYVNMESGVIYQRHRSLLELPAQYPA